jgi:hypothetical protein
MKKIIIFVAVFCLALVGFAERVLAGPVPVSVQEGAQLNALGGNDALLTLKAGGAFPDAPIALAATEESALRNLSSGSPNLAKLKAGDGPVDVLVLVVVIVCCVLLLRLII